MLRPADTPMLFKSPYSLAVAGLILFAACPVSAHEIKEMTARARIFNDRVELVITISSHMAGVLLAGPKDPPVVLTPDTFANFRAKLEEQGKAFCIVRSKGGAALEIESEDVVMARPEELSFFVTYRVPAPTPLRFEMTVLDRIEPGYSVTLDLLNAARQPLGSKLLQHDDPTFEISPDSKPVPVLTTKP